MSAQRTTFGKLERDRAKKARAAAKRERRQAKSSGPDDAPDAPASADVSGANEESTAQVLELLASIHERFEAGTLSYEELEERKAELLGRLEID